MVCRILTIRERATELAIPEVYDVLAMITIGKPGKKAILPFELQEREAPSDRKPLNEIIMEGNFKK